MVENPEVTVLMPTYNDSEFIAAAIESLRNQTRRNFELIVIDGSTDNTPEIVKEIAENDDRIRYLREPHSGQLNALAYGADFIRGRYVTMLHSDDMLSDAKAFERNILALEQTDCDGVFSDLLTMNREGAVNGKVNTVKSLDDSSLATLFLRAGSNMIPDFFFVKREAFRNVFSSYITWNMPYWLRFDENGVSTLRLKKVEPWYMYRVYGENYLRSDVGKFETVNGCLRTVLEIGQRINPPLLSIQRLLVRIFKTRIKPVYKFGSCPPENLRKMVQYVINSYYLKVPQNTYFNGLMGFYSNFPSKRTIKLRFEEEAPFLGKDARVFYNMMQRLPAIYDQILGEAASGFGTVSVSEKDYEKSRDMLRFLNLLADIRVE
ncbi:glycosyltransferase family 2 protein [Candidatus Bathyarchaeota archaeon A05DMB-2]|nr:glycosyltransferase family 2 protein [Candidatus Bathyarchaeota archaeon A05DMB-2]